LSIARPKRLDKIEGAEVQGAEGSKMAGDSRKKRKTPSASEAGSSSTKKTQPAAAAVPPAKPVSVVSTLIGHILPVVSTQPLPAGTPGNEVSIDAQTLQNLVVALATESNAPAQVWVKDSSELLVFSGKVQLALNDGLVLMTIPVSCDQSTARVQVPFAVGSKDQPSGLMFATEERPRGPDVIVDVWGEALTAFAWRLLMDAVVKVAAQSGVDADGAGLVPIALAAAPTGVTLLPMARHPFDRVRR